MVVNRIVAVSSSCFEPTEVGVVDDADADTDEDATDLDPIDSMLEA